ncbi:LLM class flavin-dependent oxidoreductase [Paenibacillus agilis]|uniref:LLM class flavin-dependent oxidoreductase n=1 Tax=Paenibacillus agilis TaxID=3020863 RepID=A0A559J0Z8_9BACL|nr:LLM class flavin-dependent oxidoreductase [Paenibacillus agilis]TVX93568.1 LLM class flavin-dependent oxidoreductase [Paenibacillus agilis]
MNNNFEFYTDVDVTLYGSNAMESDIKTILKNHVCMAEKFNYKGTLITTSSTTLDPWMIASHILENTQDFTPLLALQPYTMPPITAVKMVQTLEVLYGRRIGINFVTGISTKGLSEAGVTLSHDELYIRLQEYISLYDTLIRSGNDSVTFSGKYYELKDYRAKPNIPFTLFNENDRVPEIFVSGSSDNAIKTAIKYGNVYLTHPGPIERYRDKILEINGDETKLAIGIGVIAQAEESKAWSYARSVFKPNRKSIIEAAMKRSSHSQWIKDQADLSVEKDVFDHVYWTGAFKSNSLYPYIVGDYDQVASYLQQYVDIGVQTFIIGGPYTEEDYVHRQRVFQRLKKKEGS